MRRGFVGRVALDRQRRDRKGIIIKRRHWRRRRRRRGGDSVLGGEFIEHAFGRLASAEAGGGGGGVEAGDRRRPQPDSDWIAVEG